MDIMKILITFWHDKKKRNKCLFAILLIVWAITFLQMMNKIFWKKDEGAVATMIVMMCPKCSIKENVPVETSAGEIKCKKCGADMGFAYKCRDCKFEYSLPEVPNVSPKATPDKLIEAQRMAKCPNCGSFNTEPISQ